MTDDARNLPGEQLRQAMRRWATGVSIVSSQHEGKRHGMTVNSFVSISLEPPLVSVTLANDTRTFMLVQESGHFGVTILDHAQIDLAEIFAGRVPDGGDRFSGVETYTLQSETPLLVGGLAGLDCKVVHAYTMPNSTLMIGQVQAVNIAGEGKPLVYFNRGWRTLD